MIKPRVTDREFVPLGQFSYGEANERVKTPCRGLTAHGERRAAEQGLILLTIRLTKR
jgi:hypothetical protein